MHFCKGGRRRDPPSRLGDLVILSPLRRCDVHPRRINNRRRRRHGRNTQKAVEERLAKETDAWSKVGRRIFRNKAINPNGKYTASELTNKGREYIWDKRRRTPRKPAAKMDSYMYKQMRCGVNPNWKMDERYPPKMRHTSNLDNQRRNRG